VAAIALAVFALSQRNQAVDNLNTVRSLELASAAQALAKNPRRSTQLALEALSIRRTSQAEAALRAGVGALGPVFTGDTGTVNTAVFSPDGRTILTASSDGTARLRDVSHRRLLAVLHAGSAALASAAFSPDGRMVVTAGADGVARIWSALSGHLLRAVAVKRVPGRSGPGEAPAALTDAQFSPEGNEVVTAAADGSARFWDTGSGRQIGAPLDAASGAPNSASFSPDGRLIVTAGADGVAKIWTVASHQQFGRQLVGGGGAINQAEFSPSGRYIVTAGTDDTARVWSVGSQRQVAFPLISGGTVYSAAFSPDEHFIATTSADNTVRIWREGNGTQPTILRGSVDDATFDPKGTRLVMAGLDQKVRVSGATIPVLTGPLTTLERVARGLL
jgi:WD40 repeat protein